MRSNKYYPCIRGKPNPIWNMILYEDGAHLWKVNDSIVYDIQEKTLPRGVPIWGLRPLVKRLITRLEECRNGDFSSRGWPLIFVDYLPRGKSQGLKNCKPSQDSCVGMPEPANSNCREPTGDLWEIFGEGGIYGYLLT